MPKYFYSCQSCSDKRAYYHSMSEDATECKSCGSQGTLDRMPSSFVFEAQKEDRNETGQLVKNAIEEAKEDLIKQQDELKSEYDANK